MHILKVATLLATLALAVPAAARQIEVWSYERLFKEAELVVIASAQGTVGTDDRAAGPWGASLVGRKTTFAVHAVLKGEAAAGPLTVLHFKMKDGVASQNGPLLVSFRTKGPTIEGGGAVKYKAQLGTPQYLLFLKAGGEGVFEPVSGQVDPLLSVKEIYSPLPEVMDRR